LAFGSLYQSGRFCVLRFFPFQYSTLKLAQFSGYDFVSVESDQERIRIAIDITGILTNVTLRVSKVMAIDSEMTAKAGVSDPYGQGNLPILVGLADIYVVAKLFDIDW
jgi:hypothetical protein